MRVLVIGYNALDITVDAGGLPHTDTKHEVAGILIGGGGPAATAAVCLARLGADVSLVTVFGDDEGAALQRRELDAAGVDLARCVIRPGFPSARAVILVDPAAAARTIFWSRGGLPPLAMGEVDPAWLDDYDLLYCDGHEPLVAASLAQRARSRGLPVVLDAGSVRPGTAELLPHCTDVIASSSFVPAFTGCVEPEMGLRRLQSIVRGRVAATYGAAGVLALAVEPPQAAFHVPAYEVAVRDTTGAGDAFHAGYAFARLRGDDWPDGLDFGAAVAALKCRDWGGRLGLPTLAEVGDLMNNGTRRHDAPPGRPVPPAR